MASPPEPANSLMIITFGPKIGALRLHEVRAVARRGDAHEFALQVLDDVGSQRAAVVEALVDDGPLLTYLREEVSR